jgi:hypothetical protein
LTYRNIKKHYQNPIIMRKFSINNDSKKALFISVDGHKKALRAAGLPDDLTPCDLASARHGRELSPEQARAYLLDRLDISAVKASPVFAVICEHVFIHRLILDRQEAAEGLGLDVCGRYMGSGGVRQIWITRSGEIRIQISHGTGKYNHALAVCLTIREYIEANNQHRRRAAEIRAKWARAKAEAQ